VCVLGWFDVADEDIDTCVFAIYVMCVYGEER
jgi:hypothetical protein